MSSLETNSSDFPDRRVTRKEKGDLVLSWFAMSIVGGAFILLSFGTYLAAAIFAVAMAGVHLVGYRAYANQFKRESRLHTTVAKEYWPALTISLLIQASIVILAALHPGVRNILDGSLLGLSLLAYWAMFVLLVCRRPASPTRTDLWALRYGFIVVFGAITVAGSIWLAHLGR